MTLNLPCDLWIREFSKSKTVDDTYVGVLGVGNDSITQMLFIENVAVCQSVYY